ncbi:hypothetical protein [Pseudomonas phage PMBT14]|uniref:Uncharacterized protein n=1 Tax=Pseudomonas phage PMBT14 TaxID=2059855 RepID=A0A2I6PI85_9CAUD|nr:hypothetical protein HWB42_gp35 [Pseudomonas phage PMBT14]AUM59752.1 hypothetical protein [Pseudomonas phage PMBT14]UOL48397.1 hypothetical protein [Pseudomonas phage Almagne]
MVLNGRVVSVSTGDNVEAIKHKLYSGYFRLPSLTKKVKKPRRK